MSNEEALEIAKQRWPWEKMGDVRYIATVCASALGIVIANTIFIRNCLQDSLK
jgi:hypothetical protein